MKIGIHCFISGKVQGVWFRQNSLEYAIKLNLTGWVRNLIDGRVELEVYREKKYISQFIEWLKQGPKHASVSQLDYKEIKIINYKTFTIKDTGGI